MALILSGLGWLMGVGLALWPGVPAAVGSGTPVAAVLLAVPPAVAALLARAPALRLAGVVVALLLLGWARGLSALPAVADDPLRPYFGSTAIRGVVAEPAVPGETWLNLRVRVDAVAGQAGWEPASGLVLVRLPRTAPYDYGDALELRGTLTAPPDSPGSGYGTALRRQGVRAAMDYPTVAAWQPDQQPSVQGALFALRRRLTAGLAASLPEPHAALLTGVLLGGSATMPADFRQDLRAVGLTHVVAVSGFNVTLVAAALAGLAACVVGRRAGLPVALAGVVLYTLLVGAPPSAVRAATMVAIALTAEAFGRPRDALAALVLAAALLAGWDPWLLADLGFQLSVLATAGLILLQPLLAARLSRLPAWAAEGLAATLAAQAFVLPLQLTTFHTASLVAPLANLLLVPLLPPLMVLGAAVALVGAVSPSLGPLVGLPAWGYLELIVRAVRAAAALPGARVDVGALAPFLGLAYCVGLALIVLLAAPETTAVRAWVGRMLGTPPARAAVASVAGLLVLVTLAAAGQPDARLHVAVLDIGHGDSTMIRTPNGRLVLADGGPSPATLAAHLGNRLGLMERRLDLVALTHPHEDHVAGLPQLNNCDTTRATPSG